MGFYIRKRQKAYTIAIYIYAENVRLSVEKGQL